MKTKRIGISKSTRFRIFARDSFTCKYCGRQSDIVALHVDHVIPVCKGGTNDEENLITSCSDCNLGKSGKLLTQSAPTESDRLRIAQERNEQIEAALSAKKASAARLALAEEVCNYFCRARGTTEMDRSTCATLVSYVNQFSADLVFSWIDIAVMRLPSYERDQKFGKYISGCRRQFIEESF